MIPLRGSTYSITCSRCSRLDKEIADLIDENEQLAAEAERLRNVIDDVTLRMRDLALQAKAEKQT